MASKQTLASIGGHTIKLTNLDKVLYPETGTTKAEVIDYYVSVADTLLLYSSDRPATRKRWVHGVGTAEHPGEVFFQKDLGDSAPEWISRASLQHSDHSNSYPLVNNAATLAWLGQIAALEIHVPQWRFDAAGKPQNPDRFVLDLDPGEGVSLSECAEVAGWARTILQDMGLDPIPVTSGSKGIHLYAALDGTQSSDAVTEVAHELARALEADHSDSVVSSMSRALRPGKVFIDWSQNRQAKTTIAPYSLRGRPHPMVAAPRTWRELSSRSLKQLDYRETLAHLARRGDPLAPIAAQTQHTAKGAAGDRLNHYRERRDSSKTPEPVPDAVGGEHGSRFVIHEHHARKLHFDFRLEHDHVLVSWALPKGVPIDAQHNHLAVPTEDHPVEYADFEGVIPRGEYGAGTVSIWDGGTYELEKWRDDEVIVTLHGRVGGGLGGPARFALIRTSPGGTEGKGSWLIHRMKPAPMTHAPARVIGLPGPADAQALRAEHSHTPAETLAPMLASAERRSALIDESEWAFELKWDGIRAIATVDTEKGTATLRSRNGVDLTASYPELRDALIGTMHAATSAVLDGEIIAPDATGRPSFARLQSRMGLSSAAQIERGVQSVPVQFIAFDLLRVDGQHVVDLSYDERRLLLQSHIHANSKVHIPPAFTNGFDEAVQFSLEHGLEGVVAKRRSSSYRAGQRSHDWLKFKHHRAQEVVVGGWRPGKGNREGGIGSLLLGVPSPEGLRYVGRVGTGLSDSALAKAAKRLDVLAHAANPFREVPDDVSRDAHWVRPELVAEVDFSEWTPERRLRHPIWRGWRPDKSPADVSIDGGAPELNSPSLD